jgi:hypothetical protein
MSSRVGPSVLAGSNRVTTSGPERDVAGDVHECEPLVMEASVLLPLTVAAAAPVSCWR